MKLTKELLRDLKTAKSIVIRAEKDKSTIDLFFEAKGDKREQTITYNYDNRSNQIYTWHSFLYPELHTEQNSIFDVLRTNDLIDFDVRDYGSDQLKDAGFICQHLLIHIRRHKRDGLTLSKVLEFTFDTMTVRESSTNAKHLINS